MAVSLPKGRLLQDGWRRSPSGRGQLLRVVGMAALLGLALAHPVPSVAQATGAPKTVKVRSGDTLEGISQRTGVSVAELKRLNGLKDADLLQVGQTLRLPTPPRKGVVVVKSGDTLDSIAKANNTTVTALQKSNPGIQPTTLKVGSTLRLPSSASQPAPGNTAAPAKSAASPSAQTAGPTPTTTTPPPGVSVEPSPRPLIPPTTQPTASPGKGDPASRGRWRYYGDTVVDWGGWKRMPDGVRFTLVQPAPGDVGEARAQATAIAVDCASLRHNWRVKGAWETWSIPAPRSVGQQIILDLCGNAVGDESRPIPAPPAP
jgi:LysM repeat protein